MMHGDDPVRSQRPPRSCVCQFGVHALDVLSPLERGPVRSEPVAHARGEGDDPFTSDRQGFRIQAGVKAKQTFLVLGAVLAGAGAAWLAANRDFTPYQTAPASLGLLVGWSLIGSGVVAWRVRPDNRLGPVMVFTGFAWFATFLTDAHDPLPFTFGTAVQSFYLAGFAYLILSFPSGRLERGLERALMWTAVALVTVVQFAMLWFADSNAVLCDGCPRNVFLVVRNDALASGIAQLTRVGGVVLALIALALLVGRWRSASAPQRRNVAPVVWAGGFTFIALAVSVANDVVGDAPLGQVPKQVLFVAVAMFSVAVLLVLLQRRLARGAVAGLVVDLGERGIATDLRRALARALGDPSLELVFWFPSTARFVDGDGRPVELPTADAGRIATVVKRDGEPIAALLHDPALKTTRSSLIRSARPRRLRSRTSASRSSCARAWLSCRLRGRGWSRPRKPSGDGSSATFMTGPNNGSSRWRCRSGCWMRSCPEIPMRPSRSRARRARPWRWPSRAA